MKTLLITFALIGFAAAAQLPDSATQGPSPEDIATPEPEYIDIDGPEPAPAPAPAPPAPAQPRTFAPVPAPIQQAVQTRSFAPIPAPISRPFLPAISAISHSFSAPQQRNSYFQAPSVQHQTSGHTFSRQNGYQYRRPVYIRRVYRRRRF